MVSAKHSTQHTHHVYCCFIILISYILKLKLTLEHKLQPPKTILLEFGIVVQLLSRVRLFATPWTAACQASLSFTISLSLLNLMTIESVMPSNHLIFCHPLLLLPSMFPSIRVFSSGSALCIRRPKYWGFSFSTSPSNEYSELISFRADWLDLLAVQGTLKSFFQHHSSLGLPKTKTT